MFNWTQWYNLPENIELPMDEAKVKFAHYMTEHSDLTQQFQSHAAQSAMGSGRSYQQEYTKQEFFDGLPQILPFDVG